MTHDCWHLATTILSTETLSANRILLYGPPGTGKSFASMKAANDQPVYRLYITEDTAAVDIIGGYSPGENGSWGYSDAPGILAWREGGLLVIDEIDRASGDATTALIALCDDLETARITLRTGETVQPHSSFRVVATTNALPEFLEPALQDRFTVRVNINKPNPEGVRSLSKELRNAASNSTHEDQSRNISLRSWKSFDELRESLGPDMAATLVFGDRAQTILNSLSLGQRDEHLDSDEYIEQLEEDEHYDERY